MWKKPRVAVHAWPYLSSVGGRHPPRTLPPDPTPHELERMDEIDSGGLRPRQDEIQPVLERVIAEASAYLAGLDDAPARRGDPDEVLRHFDEPLPETGTGALAALEDLIQHGAPALLHSGGPRNYHFVMGGTTPAALGADLLAVTYDQAAYAWLSSPLPAEKYSSAADPVSVSL